MKKLIRVNMSNGSINVGDVPEEYRLLGGRALTSRIVSDEVPPECDALGPYNKLVIAPGLLAGTPMPAASRLSIGGKSPLTGGIKESNSGGNTAWDLSKLQVKAIIIEGENKSGNAYCLYISNNIINLRPVETKLKEEGVYSRCKMFHKRYGKKVSLLITGPAGEKGFPTAGIASTDPDGRPSRFCARGGLGAVMGAKGLSAIVVDTADAGGIEYHDHERYNNIVRELIRVLKAHPVAGDVYPKYGTVVMVARANTMKALPTRNFSEGSFEHADNITGEKLHDLIVERGGEGKTTHACMPGCIIKCSSIFPDAAGREVVSPLEYETVGLMGSNLGIGNLDDIARMNFICNDLGIDTIEMGVALGILMDQGVIAFGDADAAVKLLKEIAVNTVMGRVLAQGAFITGKVFGSRRMPVVKGQAMAAYEPRAIKGFGVTYATSPMGADHTAGSVIRAQVDHTDPGPQPAVSKKAQESCAMVDSLGLCLFTMAPLADLYGKVAALVESLYGVNVTEEGLMEMAREALRVERSFNRKAGLGPAHDRIPEFMRIEPLPGINQVFDVPNEELDNICR